jgi:altronate hydrolase
VPGQAHECVRLSERGVRGSGALPVREPIQLLVFDWAYSSWWVTVSQASKTVLLGDSDSVAVAIADIAAGEAINDGLIALTDIPRGHKVAVTAIEVGETVIKYGQAIGVASVKIALGAHVHSHNLSMSGDTAALSIARRASEAQRNSSHSERRRQLAPFQGYRRANGRAGTRNYIGVMASVNCSATVVHEIVLRASQQLLPNFEYIDGIVPIAHQSGCGIARQDQGYAILQRTMRGFQEHPNFGGVLVIGLGCEVMGTSELLPTNPDPQRFRSFDIQGVGGTSAAIQEGLRHVRSLMEVANSDRREAIASSELIVGLQCGGSDGLSGVTANPAMGKAVDELVSVGGTALLSETPELFGAEHLLLSRARSPEVAAALRAKIAWWVTYAQRYGIELDNNPSPGNKQGGLTTVLEKSLGAVAKGGQSMLQDVIEYAQPTRERGLIFMDSPGFDPCSATGQVASGANLLLFSTGRGSCFGCKPSPSIKLSTNTEMYQRMSEDMDLDCGRIVTGAPLALVGHDIFDLVLAVASGQKTKSETLGYGDHEFVPWRLGAVL